MIFRRLVSALTLRLQANRLAKFATLGCVFMSASSLAAPALTLKQQIGQKLMLDFRYYCEDKDISSARCRAPMTTLPAPLAELLTQQQIGGVILFAENLENSAQMVELTQQLQRAAQQSELGAPLFISIDQEGGRVARIPRELGTAMTGNMSIGATYARHGTDFARRSAEVIATELNALGINLNYAPTVDVNMNPDNPVINVRSFGEDPQLVAELGGAQVDAYQRHQVIAALKHFPGHGDTNVDSHTGLPRVAHDKAQVMAQDIAPFKQIIDAGHAPGMIMTAHIQYPALDNSTFVSKDGDTMIKPATMSRAIMTDLLRDELGYSGVTITDALDMAGISHFFSAEDAVINTFKAGVDIALMPIAVRNQDDIAKLNALIDALEKAVQTGELDATEFEQSASRIMALKASYQLLPKHHKKLSKQQAVAKQVLGNPKHRALEAELASAAITDIKNGKNTASMLKNAKSVAIIMPDTRKCMALEQALQAYLKDTQFHCLSLQGHDPVKAQALIEEVDLVIAGNASPAQSAVEIGGMDDSDAIAAFALSQAQQPDALERLLKQAKNTQKPTVFVSLRAPYDIARFGSYADAILATYAYNIDVDDGETVQGPAFSALAKVLLGQQIPSGQLPVTIKQ